MNVRIFVYWVLAILFGLLIGSWAGVLFAAPVARMGGSEIFIMFFTLFVIGLSMVLLFGPVENKFYFIKIRKIHFVIENIDHKYHMPPFVTSLITGCLLGEKHYYNLMLGKYCVLPFLCPKEFCILQHCF